MIRFKIQREYIDRYHKRYQSQELFWKYVPGNGKVRGRVISVSPEGLGAKVAIVMSLEESIGFLPSRQPFSTNKDFKWVAHDPTAYDPVLRNKISAIMAATVEECRFTVNLRQLRQARWGEAYKFELGEEIDLHHWVQGTGGRRGWVVRREVDPSNPFSLNVTVRLKMTPEQEVIHGRPVLADAKDWVTAADSLSAYVLGIKRSEEMTFSFNFNDGEKKMKIYEAVIVKLDENKKPSEIAKVVPPFLAESDRAAQDAVMVDFASEKNLKGKDLAGYVVSVRTFQAVGSY